MKWKACAYGIIVALIGCGQPTTLIKKHPAANGYDVQLEGFDKCYGKIIVGRYDEKLEGFGSGEGFFYAIDHDGDRRLDEIYLWTVQPGSPLESLVSLEKITNIMMQTLPGHKKKFSKK